MRWAVFPGTMCAVRDHRVGLNLDFDLRTLFQLNLLSLFIRKPVRYPNLSVEVVCPFYSNLSFFRFSRPRMRLDDFLHFPWKRGACLSFFIRHYRIPPLMPLAVFARFCGDGTRRNKPVSAVFHVHGIGETP